MVGYRGIPGSIPGEKISRLHQQRERERERERERATHRKERERDRRESLS